MYLHMRVVGTRPRQFRFWGWASQRAGCVLAESETSLPPPHPCFAMASMRIGRDVGCSSCISDYRRLRGCRRCAHLVVDLAFSIGHTGFVGTSIFSGTQTHNTHDTHTIHLSCFVFFLADATTSAVRGTRHAKGGGRSNKTVPGSAVSILLHLNDGGARERNEASRWTTTRLAHP